MDDVRCSKVRKHVRIVRRRAEEPRLLSRDHTRELATPRPLDSLDAAFAAIAQMSLAR